jgi:hypothetical protein
VSNNSVAFCQHITTTQVIGKQIAVSSFTSCISCLKQRRRERERERYLIKYQIKSPLQFKTRGDRLFPFEMTNDDCSCFCKEDIDVPRVVYIFEIIFSKEECPNS